MEKTFSAPHLDAYIDRHFLLDRDVLSERGLDRPDMLALAVSSAQLPNFFTLGTYADHLRLDIGESEERARHAKSALAAYQSVASFGRKLQGSSSTPIEHIFAAKFQEDAYQKMLPLLRREGRNVEARIVESALAAIRTENPDQHGLRKAGLQSPAFRSGQMVFISGLILVVFTISAALWLICVALLRAKPGISRSMNWLASCLGCAPALLSLSCLALLASFFPYSRSIAEYSGAGQLYETYGAFFAGISSLRPDPILDVWIDHMFRPLIWCAVILVLGAICLRYGAWRRHTGQSGVE